MNGLLLGPVCCNGGSLEANRSHSLEHSRDYKGAFFFSFPVTESEADTFTDFSNTAEKR